MEFQKNTKNFSFGGGSLKTAGTGSLDKAVDAPAVETRKVCDKKKYSEKCGKRCIAVSCCYF